MSKKTQAMIDARTTLVTVLSDAVKAAANAGLDTASIAAELTRLAELIEQED
jgi:hypothetical protein